MKATEFKNEMKKKSVENLQSEAHARHKEMFSMRIQKNSEQAAQPHLFRKVRREIALIKTILREKEGL